MHDRTLLSNPYKYFTTRESFFVIGRKRVVSAKVDSEIAEAVNKAVREHPERYQDASSVVREAVVDLLRSLGYLRA